MPTAGPHPSVRRAGHDEALEQRILTVQKELEHTQRLATVGTIAAGVAHEVNNLLTPARAYAQMAVGSDDEAFRAKALRSIGQSIEGATRLLESILDYASPDADSAPEDADVAAVTEAALACLAGRSERSSIDVRTRIVGSTRVAMRPLGLQQVLLNLLLNAMRELAAAGVAGAITVTARHAAHGTVEIGVIDNGPGIPEDIAASLFQPFVSGRSRPRREGQGGTGLGLSICRRLVEEVGGRIWVERTEGGGATFLMTLPASKPQRLSRAG